MHKEKKIAIAILLILMIIGLNNRFGNLPPLGKFLSPFTGCMNDCQTNDCKGARELSSLKDSVTIIFDSRQVPHILATDEKDMYFALGYVHAKDRLWQMDFMSRVVSGRLSEIYGVATLDRDRIMRRKGLTYIAERTLEYLQKSNPLVIQHYLAYSAGVNQYIEELSYRDYPLEFKLMDYKPEMWSALKVILIQKYMAEVLSGYDTDAERTNALNLFGGKEYTKLYGRDISKLCPMLEMSGGNESVNNSRTPGNYDLNIIRKSFPLSADLYKPSPDNGSNTWVVGGKKSTSTYPILANDPHLELTIPSIWYEAQLSCNKSDCYGVGIPGVPYVLIGFNKHIAWGLTNGLTDVKDWYILNIEEDKYFLNGKWKQFEKRIEKISVFSGPDFIDTVKYTEIGPVVYDKGFGRREQKHNLTLKWTANIVSNDLFTFYLLNNAHCYDDYAAAVRHLQSPNLNISFASREDIAIAHQGQLYRRTPGSSEGQFIMSASQYVDSGAIYIPQDKLPHEVNPNRQFVFSANQCPVGYDSISEYYGYYVGYRNRIIERMLGKEKISSAFSKNMQLDCFDLFAYEALPVIASRINRERLTVKEKCLLDSLLHWDCRATAESIQPGIFFDFWDNISLMTWDEVLEAKIPMPLPKGIVLLEMLRNYPNDFYFNVRSTAKIERAEDILVNAWRKTVFDYEWNGQHGKNLNWGYKRGTSLRHLSGIKELNSEIILCDGSYNSVNAFTKGGGPTWRMVIEFTKDNVKAWGINSCGQSGNLSSNYYMNSLDDWKNGRYYELEVFERKKKITSTSSTFLMYSK